MRDRQQGRRPERRERRPVAGCRPGHRGVVAMLAAIGWWRAIHGGRAEATAKRSRTGTVADHKASRDSEKLQVGHRHQDRHQKAGRHREGRRRP